MIDILLAFALGMLLSAALIVRYAWRRLGVDVLTGSVITRSVDVPTPQQRVAWWRWLREHCPVESTLPEPRA